MVFLVWSLVLVLSFANVKCRVPVPLESHNPCNELACQIAREDDARVTFVYVEDSDEELLSCLSTAYQPLFTSTSVSVPPTRNYSTMNIFTIAGDTWLRLTEIANTLSWASRGKHRSKYILIFKVSCEEFLHSIFEKFWENGFLHVIALCDIGQQIYTYEPFTERGFQVVKRLRTMPPFYDKLENIHQHSLKVSLFYDPIRALPVENNSHFHGVDGILGETIIKHLNATMEIVVPPNNEMYGEILNGSLTGSLKHVSTGFTVINWNLRYIDDSLSNLVDFLYPIGKRFFLHIVVPKASVVPQYSNFIRIFDGLMWCILMCNYFVVALIFAATQQMALKLPSANPNLKINFRSIFAMFFKTAIGDPVEGFHRISSLRQFLISWILFSYIISSIYFAKMESVFIRPEYEQDINSLSELGRLKVPIYSHSNFLISIKSLVDPKVVEIVISKHRLLPMNYEAQLRAMTQGSNNNHAFILRRERALGLIARTYDRESNRPLYHMVREYLVAMPQTYIVTNGSPFMEKFEQLVIWCVEHGLMKHWEVISKAETTIEPTSANPKEAADDYYDAGGEIDGQVEAVGLSGNQAMVLNLNILQGSFYLWIIGTGAACLGFGLELAYWRWSRVRNRGVFNMS